MMKLQLLRLLLQPAAFIYEQCGQPIIVCTLAHCYSQTGGIRSLGNLAQSAAPCACPPPISERRFTQPTGIAIYFIAAIIKKHGTLLLLVCCYLKLFPICIASFMKLQRNTVKILQRLSITLSPTTSDSILNSYDPLRDKRCRQKNCREQFVPKTFTLIKLSSK